MGVLRDRVHRELTDEEIRKIADTYHAWRGERVESEEYKDILGFCKVANFDEIKKHDYILTPGRYVGFEETEDDDEEFEEKMKKLAAELSEQFRKSEELEKKIKENLAGLGYEI
jgi:type I restriction enzyme M protein